MFKKSTALFLYAETSVHAGSGESLGAIDLAIQRERYTGFPCVAAQGIKGPVRDWFERAEKNGQHTVDESHLIAAFGPPTSGNPSEHAGAVAFTDARILLFPVRSMKGVFAWITCPFVLGRLRRDLGLAQNAGTLGWKIPTVKNDDEKSYAHGASDAHACKTDQGKVLLEEEVFTYEKDDQVGQVATWLRDHALPADDAYAFWQKRLSPAEGESEKPHLLVLHDDDFRHFVKTATEVQARIALNTQKTTTGGVGNLFYQENLPPDTLLYNVVLAADSLKTGVDDNAEAMLTFTKKLDGHRLQIGGDETTGKGYVYARFLGENPARQTQPETTTEEATI
ncbi:MAG: type III-B CRISPR module RAMP protein Cmr4 [Rhodothermales bacterium]